MGPEPTTGTPRAVRRGMPFCRLILHNLGTRRVRTLLTALAVAISVMAVVTLGVVTDSLKNSAAEVLATGNADFTVAQKSVSDVLSSVVTDRQVAGIGATPGVKSAVGVLVGATKLDADHPLLLEIGVAPTALADFGIHVVSGRSYAATAEHEIMLGWQMANDLGKQVGDSVVLDSQRYTVVGIYSTNQTFANSASMFPLTTLQALERKPGTVTLVAVQVKSGQGTEPVRRGIDRAYPNLTTVRLASEYGRVDRNLQFLDAARTGAWIIALIIGVVIVMNTMLLSFVERIREFGVLRAIGWSRPRLVSLVLGEAVGISLLGAAFGVALSVTLTWALERFSSLHGILQVQWDAGAFAVALYTAIAIGIIAALYPSLRAAALRPSVALRRE
jgi:putative ABC transport system permease protein